MPPRLIHCPPDPSMSEGFRLLRAELEIPETFSEEVLAAADEVAAAGPEAPPGGGDIRDSRDIPLIAIDPQGSMDLDQAYCAERTSRGFRVFYAIADVASLVSPGGPIDIEARSRGVTLYSPDRRIPLHPPQINEHIGSLLEGADRLALLWTIELNADGEIGDAHVRRAMVRNRSQLSYRQAQKMAATAGADDPLSLLEEIGLLRIRREEARGGVSLALPSQEVVVNADGSYRLEYEESLPIEEWNAQISLLTGIAASRIMLGAGEGLLRTLPEPDHHIVSRLRRTAQALGIEWPDDVGYADRIRTLKPDTGANAAMLSQAAKGLRGAGYVAFHDHQRPPQPHHWAIASTYSHVTAPLRRLCDRFTNEVLIAICSDRPVPSWASEALDEMPALMNSAKQRDRSLERAVLDLVEAVILEPRVGETFPARVTDIDTRRKRGRVQLRDPAVVCKISSDGLQLGAEVELRLDAVDREHRKVEFSLVG